MPGTGPLPHLAVAQDGPVLEMEAPASFGDAGG